MAKEAALDFANGICELPANRPYVDDVKGVGEDFMLELTTYSDLREALVTRTTMMQDYDCKSFKEFADFVIGHENMLNAYCVAYEDGTVSLDLCVKADVYTVPLSESEQNALYTFIDNYCLEHWNESLEDLLKATRVSEKYDSVPRFELHEAYYDDVNEIPCASFDTYLPDDIRKDFVEKSQKRYKRDLVCDENTKISTDVEADGNLSMCFNYDNSREFFSVPLDYSEKRWLLKSLVNECQNKGKTLNEHFQDAIKKYVEHQKQQRNAVKDDR